MLKVVTLVGTRPEIIRLSECLKDFDKTFDHKLIHTGQNFDKQLSDVFFEEFDLKPPYRYLNCSKQSVGATIASIFVEFESVLDEIEPDCIVILGDTNSALGAYVAKRKKIPIFHIEAGNRCFDQNTPEEINRKIVDHISDVNVTYSEIARSYLISEGLKPELIFKLGSQIKEVFEANKIKIDNSKILSKLSLKKNEYLLLSMHREESVDTEAKLKIKIKILNKLADYYGKKIIFSIHPRTRIKINQLVKAIDFHPKIIFCEPFGYFDYIKLQKNSYCVVSDSGSLTEEASVIGFDAINFRDNNERPEGFTEGSTIMVGADFDLMVSSIDYMKNHQGAATIVKDYDVDNFSSKLVKLILSYTHYINREIWKKYT